jgi:hypothetical protein
MSNGPRMTLTAMTLLVAVSAAACAPRVRPPVEPREDPAAPPQINLTDRELQDRIAVSRPIVTKDEAGLLYITLPVRNTSARQMTIEYRVTWLDRNRVPIHQTTWFPKVLSGHTPDQFSINSTTPRVDDFQIDIRPGK